MAMGLSHALETRYRRRSIRGRPLYEDESERISIMARSQRLQSRPNTLVQTNCHRSFFACNSAADHTSPVTALPRTYSSSELPQMMIYMEIGMPHALGPRHLPEHPVRSELVLGTTEALE